MIFKFNKPFKANIQVASNQIATTSLSLSKKLKKVKMEDIDY